MKKLIFSLVAAVIIAGLALQVLSGEPRRARPPDFRAQWEGLALTAERDWSLDPFLRGVVQGEFFSATDQLARCVKEYDGAEGEVLVLELLVETERGGTHFEFVDAQPHPVIAQDLSDCVTRVLEQAQPLPTPALPEGKRWRLQVHFLVPPTEQVVEDPWWKKLLPGRWRPRTGSKADVG